MSLAISQLVAIYIWQSKMHQLSTGSAELGEFFLFVGAYTVGWFDFEKSNHLRPHVLCHFISTHVEFQY